MRPDSHHRPIERGIIVPAHEIEAFIVNGWRLADALAAALAKARDLGILDGEGGAR